MAKFRMVRTDFWKNPMVLEEMTPEDRYFYLYLLTNPNTTQIGIYKITQKQMAFDLGYSLEGVHSLMERFIYHHKVIRYNHQTRELAIRFWGKENLHKAGKPVMDCMVSELKEVEDFSLIQYVSESIQKPEIRQLYESFCQQKEMFSVTEEIDQDDTYLEFESELLGEQEDQQQAPTPNIENRIENHPLDVKEIIEFWDANGFGFTNLNAKQQLLSWLDDSTFIQPKEMIVKALNIACANNKRTLSYVVGILKNWKNESLVTVEDVDSYQVNEKSKSKQRQAPQYFSTGRDIPMDFVFDLTDGED